MPSFERFWREVTRDGRAACALEGTRCHRCVGRGRISSGVCSRCAGSGVIPCSSIMDAHHFVPKRRLRTAVAKQDVRNGVPLCRDHHDLVEQGYARSPRPPLLAFFLAEHGVRDADVPKARTQVNSGGINERRDQDLQGHRPVSGSRS